MSGPHKLGKRSVSFRAPVSACVAWEIVGTASAASPLRGWGAAIGACWGEASPGAPRVQISECGFKTPLYGERVVNELLERGATLEEIRTAGEAALRCVNAALKGTGAAEVKAAEGFSEGQQE